MRRRGPRAAPRRKRRAAGVSLVELLVAVLVMGVGVLGVAGLMVLSMQGNRSAMFGTEAVLLAEDMMDRIRANSGGSGAAGLYGGLALGDPPPASLNCSARVCTAEQMARYDQAVWKCRLGRFTENPACVDLVDTAGPAVGGAAAVVAGLPDGDGAVVVGPAGNRVGVRVRWRDRGEVRSVALQSRIR